MVVSGIAVFPGSSLWDIVLSAVFNVNVIFVTHEVFRLLIKSPFVLSFHNWSENKNVLLLL